MSSRYNSPGRTAAPWRWAFEDGGQGSQRETILYVADDHGLGVDIDPGALDCRSLVAQALPFKAKRFAVTVD